MSGSVSLINGHIDPETSRMTDKEIIKALECCKKLTYNGWGENRKICEEECPYKANCYDEEKNINMLSDVLDLINRQQATIDVYMQENDKLKTAYIQVSEDRNEIRKETEAEIEAWKKINQRLYDEMEERRKEDIGVAKGYARIKAIKEFAERLKGKQGTVFPFGSIVSIEDIDNLVKEMVGK